MLISIQPVTFETENQAKQLILNGFSEYFSTVRPELNPDLLSILKYYSKAGNLFLVGLVDQQVLCTGGLKKETLDVVRIVRMSVAEPYRKQGIGLKMLTKLEHAAKQMGYKQIVIETNNNWEKPIALYKRAGYKVTGMDEQLIHFEKNIEEVENGNGKTNSRSN
jgi:GNAT superfamily N-acetyltransferase